MEAVGTGKFRFGEYDLDPARRTLLRAGQPVELYSKTFDLLCELVANHGRVVSKDELLESVWPDQIVEENNLTVQMSALRKVFGGQNGAGRYIATVPGQGYKFVAGLEQGNNDDIVIEHRTFERIVFERDGSGPRREIDAVPSSRNPLALKSVKAGWFRDNPLAAGIYAGIAILLLVGGGYFVRYRLSGEHAFARFVQHNVRQLTTNGKVGGAALSPDGKLFAYTVDDLGQKSLWLGYVEGGNHLLLRPAVPDATYFDLAFAADSARLYFSYKDDKMGAASLYRMPVSGGVPEKIGDSIENFALSASGAQIAYGQSVGDSDLLVVSEPDGGDRREIASFPKTRSFLFDSISWSPDGTRLAISKAKDDRPLRSDLALVTIADGRIQTIRDDKWREILETAWLRDGSGIIVSAIKGNAWASVPKYQLFQVDISSGRSQEITRDLSSYVSVLDLPASGDAILTIEHRQLNNIWIAPADDLSAARQVTFGAFGKYDGHWGMDFTPDGKIVYTNSDTESSFISEMNLDGAESKPLTSPGKIDSVLSVSNDGRYVVFHSDRINGDFDIWRMGADGGDPKQLTFGGKNYQPFISADSRWVYYKSWEKEIGELRRVSIDGGEPEVLNSTETSWGSASPDGKFLAASYITDKRRLAIFSATTHEVVKQFDLPRTATLLMGSHWTPDSQAVIYRDSVFGYWRQPIDGTDAQRLKGLPEEKLYNFAFSKDGTWFAFVRGQEIRDVILVQSIGR